MSILLDIFINIPTLLFLNVLNSKNINLIIIYGLIIDYVISNTYGFVTIYLIIFYFINKKIKNYYLFNILSFIILIIVLYVIYRFKIIYLFISLLIQLIFILINKNHIIRW